MKQSEVYVIRCELTGLMKIGMSTNPNRRLMGIQTGYPYKLSVHRTFPTDHPRLLESHLHQVLAHHRLNGEWFSASGADGIEEAVASFNIDSNPKPKAKMRRSELLIKIADRTQGLTDGKSYDSDDDEVIVLHEYLVENSDVFLTLGFRTVFNQTFDAPNGKRYNSPVSNVNKLLKLMGYAVVEAGCVGGRKNPHYKYKVVV